MRTFLCRWLSLHDMVCIDPKFKGTYELHECKHCGFVAAIHWHFRNVILLGDGVWK